MPGKRKRRRSAMPSMILWDRGQQLRFIEAVEALVAVVDDVRGLYRGMIIDKLALDQELAKARSNAAKRAHETRRQRQAPPATETGSEILTSGQTDGSDLPAAGDTCHTLATASLPAIAAAEVAP